MIRVLLGININDAVERCLNVAVERCLNSLQSRTQRHRHFNNNFKPMHGLRRKLIAFFLTPGYYLCYFKFPQHDDES
jgi:hypothetical protein